MIHSWSCSSYGYNSHLIDAEDEFIQKFHQTIRQENNELFESMMANNAVGKCNKFKLSNPLYTCVEHNRLEMAERLFTSGINHLDNNHGIYQPYHQTKKFEYNNISLGSLNNYFSSETEIYYGSPFHFAIYKKRFKLIEVFLRNGVNPDVKNLNDQSAFLYSVTLRNIQIIQSLIDYQHTDINTQDDQLMTVLHLSIRKNQKIFFETLINYHVNIEVENILGHTAVMTAIIENNIDFLKILINNNANLTKSYKSFNNLYEYALKISTEEIVLLILSSKPEFLNQNIGNCLIVTAKRGFLKVLKLLLQNSILQINYIDKYDKTALLWSITYCHYECTEWLLLKGADGNHRELTSQYNSLTYACQDGNIDLIIFLVMNSSRI